MRISLFVLDRCTHTLRAEGPNAERSGLLSRQVAAGCPTRGGAQKINRDTPGHRNAIASLAIKLLPSETTSQHLPRWKPVPRGIKFGSSSAGNIIPANASRCERYLRWYLALRSLYYICSFSPFFYFQLFNLEIGTSFINLTWDERFYVNVINAFLKFVDFWKCYLHDVRNCYYRVQEG